MSSVRDDIQRFYNFAMEKIQTSEEMYFIEDLFELWRDKREAELYSEDDGAAILASYQDVKAGGAGTEIDEFTNELSSDNELRD